MTSLTGPILFVEDDPDDQFIYQEICNRLRLPNQLKFFHAAEAVLTYLRETTDKPFIIFCDINMPEMNGLQLRKQINNEDYLRRKSIPFIFFSTAASAEQVRTAYELTVQGFFIKDHSFQEAEQTIKTILDYWRKCRHPNTLGK